MNINRAEFRLQPDLRSCGIALRSRPHKNQPVQIALMGPGAEMEKHLSYEDAQALWIALGHALDAAREATSEEAA